MYASGIIRACQADRPYAIIAMQQNNGDGSENYILEGLQHANRIWDLQRGGIELAIYQVQK